MKNALSSNEFYCTFTSPIHAESNKLILEVASLLSFDFKALAQWSIKLAKRHVRDNRIRTCVSSDYVLEVRLIT